MTTVRRKKNLCGVKADSAGAKAGEIAVASVVREIGVERVGADGVKVGVMGADGVTTAAVDPERARAFIAAARKPIH